MGHFSEQEDINWDFNPLMKKVQRKKTESTWRGKSHCREGLCTSKLNDSFLPSFIHSLMSGLAPIPSHCYITTPPPIPHPVLQSHLTAYCSWGSTYCLSHPASLVQMYPSIFLPFLTPPLPSHEPLSTHLLSMEGGYCLLSKLMHRFNLPHQLTLKDQ